MSAAVKALMVAEQIRAPKDAMMVVFDKDGRPVSFWSEHVHGTRKRPIMKNVDARTLPPGVFPSFEIEGWEENPECRIPADAVEISEEHYRDLIENPGRRRMCARRKRPVACAPPPPPPATAADIRGELVRRIQRAQAEAMADGVPVEESAAALRAAAARLAALDPIPADYFDDKHWA